MTDKYILADWHGAADYADRDFRDLAPNEMDIYFYYSREIGASTCKAACSHCFLRGPGEADEKIELPQTMKILYDLQTAGYKIGLTPPDSFGDELLESGDAGSAYRIEGLGNMAWTSGAPLALPGWEDRLARGYSMGFRTIILNAHDAAGINVPFGGVTKKRLIDQAICNIRTWSQAQADGGYEDIGITFTLRRDNCGYEAMEQMTTYAIDQGASVLRFNCFADFLKQPAYEHHMMDRLQIEQVYRNVARLHQEHLAEPIRFSISEDFGEAGVAAIEPYIDPKLRGQQVGICRAGWKLFAITPINGKVMVVGCVDRIAPYLGEVVERGGKWTIDWYYERMESLRQARINGGLYGCFGGVGRDRAEGAGFNQPEGNEMLARLTAPKTKLSVIG